MLDVKLLVSQLGAPWWSPRPPQEYVVSLKGGNVGVGRLVALELMLPEKADTAYGVWNLTLLSWGSYSNPRTQDGQLHIIQHYTYAQQFGAEQVRGAPLASFAMLMSPVQFVRWAMHTNLPDDRKNLLVSQLQRLRNSVYSL